MNRYAYTWEEGVVRADGNANFNTMRSYTAPNVYSTEPKKLCFIPDSLADDTTFLENLIYEGYWQYIGKYDNESQRDVHFLTNDPFIRLSGWNVLLRPVQQWLGWIVNPGFHEPMRSDMYTFE
tara:strand:- start:366 stop:734 length:369 start_codon:yes stop_codon:yes gene_type:complete